MRTLPILLIAVSSCSSARPAAPRARTPRFHTELAARQGPFERRHLLTGEVDAVALAELKVPRVPAGRATIRFLATEGAQVKKGDKIAELDNTAFVSILKERALKVNQMEVEVKRQEWANQIGAIDRSIEIERRRLLMRKAQVDADVPSGVLPRRDYLEKQILLRKATADLEKAEEAGVTQKRTAEVDLRLKKVNLEKVIREVRAAEQAIADLTLIAPVDGTILIGDHHMEGRKLQPGDDVFVGMTVARLPDLSQIRVRAWLSDVDDGRIAAGMPVEVTLDAFPGRLFSGKVLEIAPVAREAYDKSLRRVFQVNVGLDRTGAPELGPGLSARVEVIAERTPNATLVPRMTLELVGEAPKVHVPQGAPRNVSIGSCNAQECVVLSGVQNAERLARVVP